MYRTGAHFSVVVTDQVFPDVEVERSLIEPAGGELRVASGSREEVLAAAGGADAILNTYFALDAGAIASLERCKVIARYGIGVDNVDLEAARRAGIAVTNVPDYCVEEVATHAVGLILALVRRIPQGNAIVKGGGWGIGQLGEVRRLSELTVGLLGYGRIARRVSVAVAALGARVLVHDPYVASVDGAERQVGFDELIATADVLSVHCPLTPETRGIVNAKTIKAMKPGAIVVNTSRGPIVSLGDVLGALRDGHLAGAGLDVLEVEPPPSSGELEAVPNLLLTPHAAFYSREAIRESQQKAATQVLKALRGEPLDYQVN